jgi:predicted nucleic acid-binding protein
VRRFIALLEGLAIVVDGAGADHVFREVLRIARGESLSSYDSAYLELAIREDLALATLDARMRTAAANLGVSVFNG